MTIVRSAGAQWDSDGTRQAEVASSHTDHPAGLVPGVLRAVHGEGAGGDALQQLPQVSLRKVRSQEEPRTTQLCPCAS